MYNNYNYQSIPGYVYLMLLSRFPLLCLYLIKTKLNSSANPLLFLIDVIRLLCPIFCHCFNKLISYRSKAFYLFISIGVC